MGTDATQWPITAAMIWAAPAAGTGPDRWRRDLEEVRRCGYDQVDPTDSWLAVAELAPAERGEFGALVAELGLGMPALSTARRSVVDPERGDEELAYLHRVIDAAAELRIPLVSMGTFRPLTEAQRRALWFWTAAGPVDDPAQRPLAVARLRELADHAGSVGVALSLEMYEDTFLGEADSSVRLVEEIGRDNLGLNPDLGNLQRLHRPVEHWRAMAEKTLPLANYWHVKNYSRTEDASTGAIVTAPSPMLGGVIDYRWAVEYAFEHGFRGAFCTEHYGGDGLGMSAANRDYLRHLLAGTLARIPAEPRPWGREIDGAAQAAGTGESA